jgi:hypothetical protein
MPDDALLLKAYQARNQYAASLGIVSELPVPPLEGPPWPGLREGWRAIRRESSVAIMSDGLSDPFPTSQPNTGLGIEVLAETTDTVDPIESSWLLAMARALAMQFVEHGGFRNLIDKLGLICLELDDGQGVLLGVRPDDFAPTFHAPGGEVRIMTATMLTPQELDYAARFRREGLAELEKRLSQQGFFHRSSRQRGSVVDALL